MKKRNIRPTKELLCSNSFCSFGFLIGGNKRNKTIRPNFIIWRNNLDFFIIVWLLLMIRYNCTIIWFCFILLILIFFRNFIQKKLSGLLTFFFWNLFHFYRLNLVAVLLQLFDWSNKFSSHALCNCEYLNL